MGATRLVSESFWQLRESESSIHNGSNIRGIERGHVVLLIAAACYDKALQTGFLATHRCPYWPGGKYPHFGADAVALRSFTDIMTIMQ
jgi:hypothetical protein